MNTTSLVKREIEELHAFFVAWFTGDCPEDDATFERGFAERITDGFALIQPNGLLLEREDLSGGLRRGFGKSPGFAIAIRAVEVLVEDERTVVARYQEWQMNARSSDSANNARWSTAIFKRDPARPTGLAWHFVHETSLASALVSEDAFDFGP